MNKKIILALGAMAIAAFIGLIFSQNLSVSAGPDLTEEDVKEKVRSQYPGEITEVELDEKGKNPVYEIEIVIEGKEYELLIDGNSGEVLKLDEKLVEGTKEDKGAKESEKEEKSLEISEKADDNNNVDDRGEENKDTKQTKESNGTKETNTVENKTSSNQAVNKEPAKKQETKQSEPPKQKKQEAKPAPKKESNKKSVISRDKAIQIALGQFSGNVEEVELDSDDGHLIYEIEIESSRGDAEIEIDAYTGKILVVDIDLEDDDE